MEEKKELDLICENCRADYKKPHDFKVWNDSHPNIFFKWSLTYCDDCRRAREGKALKRLPEVIKALTNPKEH